MTDFPEPLVPAEVDLTDFAFMPLDVTRLLSSEWWITACAEDPRRAAAAVNLWAASWHQKPAASLPASDVVLARLAMTDLGTWKEIREAVLEPWLRCSDGRLYHPVVAEKALESWDRKTAGSNRREEHRERMRQWRAAKASRTEASRDDHVNAPNVHVTSLTGTETGTEREEEYISSTAGAAEQPEKAVKEPSEGYTAEFEAWWALYPRKDGKGAAFKAWKRAKARAPVDKLMAGAKAYAARRAGQDPQFTKQPATWLNADGWNDEPMEALPPKARSPGYTMPSPAGG